MVSKAPIRNGLYDEWLELGINCIDDHMKENEDDWLILIIGATGTGKSNLALHMMDLYLKEKGHIDLIGLNRESIALATKKAKDMPFPRMAVFDEANISKRDSLTKFNKDMIDLFLAVRGLQIFWVWCNPSLDYLDKQFINERIQGFYYIPQKTKKARPYYYFPKKNIIRILEKHGHLKESLLHKMRKKYAYYRGWFKPYEGHLLKEYLEKKEFRMDEKVEEFFANYGKGSSKDYLTKKSILDYLGCTSDTFKKYEKELIDNGMIIENENMIIHPTGKRSYKNTLLDDFEKIVVRNKSKYISNLRMIGGKNGKTN